MYDTIIYDNSLFTCVWFSNMAISLTIACYVNNIHKNQNAVIYLYL